MRDRSRSLLHITEHTRERYQQLHDMVYLAAATLVVNPLIYLGSGEQDYKKIATASIVATGIAMVSGGVMGYSVDLFRDLTNYTPSHRVPEKIRNARPWVKKTLAVGLVTASVGLAGSVYYLTPDVPEQNNQPVQTQETQGLEEIAK